MQSNQTTLTKVLFPVGAQSRLEPPKWQSSSMEKAEEKCISTPTNKQTNNTNKTNKKTHTSTNKQRKKTNREHHVSQLVFFFGGGGDAFQPGNFTAQPHPNESHPAGHSCSLVARVGCSGSSQGGAQDPGGPLQSRTPKSGLQNSCGVDYRVPKGIYFLDPPRALSFGWYVFIKSG